MNKVWDAHNISLATKLKPINGVMITILICGCESWKQLKEIENSVRKFESGCLRKILKIMWYNHMSEIELWGMTGQQSMVEVVKYVDGDCTGMCCAFQIADCLSRPSY